MKIEAIHPTGIKVTNKHEITPFNVPGVTWDLELKFIIEETDHKHEEKVWHNQQIIVTYHSMINGLTCGVTVRNNFAMLLGDDKLIPSTQEDFEIYADMVQAALAHTRTCFHYVFEKTQFLNEFLPLEGRKEMIALAKKGVYETLN